MGCDIHVFVEVRKWVWEYNPICVWDFCNYGVFGFLAGVRNYSAIKPIKEPTYQLPEDCSEKIREQVEFDGNLHSLSFLTLKELLDVDYDEIVWDRRVTRTVGNITNGGCTTDDPNEGKRLPLKEFLGKSFMSDLESLKSLGSPENVRIVFAFDN